FITLRNAKRITSEFTDRTGWKAFIRHGLNSKENQGLFDIYTKDKAEELIDQVWSLDKIGGSSEIGLFTKSRNDVSIGRFINKILPNKYTQKEIEEFVNVFKSTKENKSQRFELVDGDDINYWYSEDNYKGNSGTLGNSCMKSKKGLFEIYTENPDVCKLLILLEDGKLIGRALVWKLFVEEDDDIKEMEWFMDRQYTTEDSVVSKFISYAKENGWAYKTHNNHHSFDEVTFKGERERVHMIVKLDNFRKINRYPYMDTFRRYDPERGFLFNDDVREDKYEGNFILNSTWGGYEEIISGVFSEWEDQTIRREDAVWSDRMEDWLSRDRIVIVERGEFVGIYPEDHEEIIWDDDNMENYHIDDCYYNDRGEFIFKEDAVKIISKIDINNGNIRLGIDWSKDLTRRPNSYYELSEGIDGTIWWKYISEKASYYGMSRGIQDFDEIVGISRGLMMMSTMNPIKRGVTDLIPIVLGVNVFKVKRQQTKDSSFSKGLFFSEEDGYNQSKEIFTKTPRFFEPIDSSQIPEYMLPIDAYILGYTIDLDDIHIVDSISYTLSIEPISSELKSRLEKIVEILDNIGDKAINLPKIWKVCNFVSRYIENVDDTKKFFQNRSKDWFWSCLNP
ncbi:hypothetical protein EBU71_16255, partial [bacterium]|nr:hypothetical protein [Candidatus Elulimicrobium humile]